MKTQLRLPLPPSTNRLWRAGKGRVYKSAKYTAWFKEAWVVWRGQKTHPIKGKFALSMVAHKPDKRRRDLDNTIKSTMDFLTQMGIIQDDSLCEDLHIKWAKEISNEGCYITIIEVE